MSNNRSKSGGIPWVLIILGFVFAWPLGLVLLFVKILSENSSARARNSRDYQPPGRSRAYRQATKTTVAQADGVNKWDWRSDMTSSSSDNTSNTSANKTSTVVQSRRTYSNTGEARKVEPAPKAPAAPKEPFAPKESAHKQAGSNYRYNYDYKGYNYKEYVGGLKTARLERKLNGAGGRGTLMAGMITLITGAIIASIVFLAGAFSAGGFNPLENMLPTLIVVATICLPGAVLAIAGGASKERAERCTHFYNMMKGRKTSDIKAMARSMPCSYSQACKDLRWMIHQGFFPGAYIDASTKTLVYAGAQEVKVETEAKIVKEELKEERPKGSFPEAMRIRELNDEIGDSFVSERMERLEELTIKIFIYIEDHPQREDRIRQFKNHYLPKTVKILESYARFEKQGVAGANIRSAMKDVEEIMDTLVSGFEKQLDMLFVDEAMDVTTDINVLESMMSLQGLRSDDPFRLENLGEISDDIAQ